MFILIKTPSLINNLQILYYIYISTQMQFALLEYIVLKTFLFSLLWKKQFQSFVNFRSTRMPKNRVRIRKTYVPLVYGRIFDPINFRFRDIFYSILLLCTFFLNVVNKRLF